jgi:Flp pilus assembly protein TadB
MLVTIVVLMRRTNFGNMRVLIFCQLLFMSYLCNDWSGGDISFAYSYIAMGVFVLFHLFREASGKKAPRIKVEFNDFLEVLHSSSVHFIL